MNVVQLLIVHFWSFAKSPSTQAVRESDVRRVSACCSSDKGDVRFVRGLLGRGRRCSAEDSVTLTPRVSDPGGARGLAPYQEGPPLSHQVALTITRRSCSIRKSCVEFSSDPTEQ